MAIYLEDMSVGEKGRLNKFSAGATASRAGEVNFLDQRSTFHRGNLAGVPGFFPPLRSGANAQQEGPTTFVRLILDGVRSVLTEVKPTPHAMPSFAWKLVDREIAAVATYIDSSGEQGAVRLRFEVSVAVGRGSR